MKRTVSRLREVKQIDINNPSKFNPDSEEAYFGKDNSGPEDNDVIVGKFIWHRKKSNDNFNDTGEDKGGFTFYYARHVYDDKYFYYIPKRKNKKQVIPDRYYGVGQLPKPDNSHLLAIDVKEEVQEKNIFELFQQDTQMKLK